MLNRSEEKTVLFHFSYQQNMLINSLQDYPTPSDVDFFKNKYMYWHLIEKKSFWIRKILMTFWLGSCMVNGPKTKPGKPLCAVVINYYLWYLLCSTPRSLYEILSCARYLAQQGENISSGHMVAVLSSREFGQSAPPTFQKLLSNCHQDGKNT